MRLPRYYLEEAIERGPKVQTNKQIVPYQSLLDKLKVRIKRCFTPIKARVALPFYCFRRSFILLSPCLLVASFEML